MKTQIIRGLLLVTILLGLLLPGAPAGAVEAKGVSPEKFLNTDGTLNLDGAFSGALDLRGYNVILDPVRGPVFGPGNDESDLPVAAALPGNWTGVGDGGGNIDGYVRAIAVSGADVYVGGDFTDAANIPEADYIAKWDALTGNWSALGSNGSGDGVLNGAVYALAVNGTDVYAGGSFSNLYNQGALLSAADYIAKWDALTGNWSALGSNGTGDGALNNSVLALAVDGTNVYAGGWFTNVNNNGAVLDAADYLAQWDGSNWSALGNDGASNGSLNGLVNTIAVSGSTVYVGGSFFNVNNGGVVLTAADYVAQWDTLTGNWSALGSNGFGNGSLKSAVYALAVNGADVYVGGLFTDVSNNGLPLTAADYLAKWDGANWSALGNNGAGNGALNGYVRAILTNGVDVYVGGGFTNVNNNGAALGAADYLAKWDGNNWSAPGDNGAGDGVIPHQPTSFIAALAMQGGNLLASGGFYDLNNGGAVLPQADYIAQWDGANWSSLGTGANGALVNGYAGGQVNAIAVMGTDVYVGGWFTDVSNHGLNIPEADFIAKWDGLNWSALGGNGNGDGSLIGRVSALAVNGTDLYVGGTFSNVNNNGISLPTADYIAKWDTLSENWSALGSNGAGNGALPGSSYVLALAVDGTDVYVGGGFTNVNNNGVVIPEADYLAQWDTLTGNWSALGSNGAGDGALNGYVAALAVSGSTLYAGGGFSNAANLPKADYIAQWDGSNWSALGSNGAGDGSLNGGVVAIAPAGSSVYVGGYFTNVNNGGAVLNNADLIAEWDTLSGNWSALGSNGMGDGVFCVACGSSVSAIFVNSADVYVGGIFTNLNSNGTILNAVDYLAKWDGVSWSALGSNGAGNGSIPTTISTRVNVISAAGSDLLVGGQFSNVNNNGAVVPEADYLAAFGMTGGGPDTTPPTVVSVTRLDPNPTGAAGARFLVTFSEAIGGLDVSDFHVEAGGVTGAVITQMDCTGATCTITVSTGSGSGTIRLDVWDDDSIKDAANNPLGGVGVGNGDFTGGEMYDVQPSSNVYLPLILN